MVTSASFEKSLKDKKDRQNDLLTIFWQQVKGRILATLGGIVG